MGYRTKTQKKNALMSIQNKSMKLFSTGCMSMKDANAIQMIVDRNLKRL
jgi:hypothetical protein